MRFLFKKLFILILCLVFTSWSIMFSFPQSASGAYTCAFGTLNTAGQCVGFINAGTTSWTVPIDWSNTNKIECIGSGGGGTTRQSSSIGGVGGGAGAYAKRSNIVGLSGSITVSVGAAGATASTTFNSSVSGKDVVCDWGRAGASGVAGVGGVTAASIGDTNATYAGGGGYKPLTGNATGGGGGGAGGPSGAGSTATGQTGGAADNGTVTSSATASSNGTAGTEFDATHGSGSGGTGGSGASKNGGTGGQYGGGGAGTSTDTPAGTAGAGFAGLIVVTYTPVSVTRIMRLFEGFKINFQSGRIIIRQKQ